MVHAVIEYCKLDMMPIEQSEMYRYMKQRYGDGVAADLVYEVIYPPLEQEREDDGS